MLLMTSKEERSDLQRPSMAQDIVKGRRTEIELMNGFTVEQSARVGRASPAYQALVEAVRWVERGELAPSPDVVQELLPASARIQATQEETRP